MKKEESIGMHFFHQQVFKKNLLLKFLNKFYHKLVIIIIQNKQKKIKYYKILVQLNLELIKEQNKELNLWEHINLIINIIKVLVILMMEKNLVMINKKQDL